MFNPEKPKMSRRVDRKRLWAFFAPYVREEVLVIVCIVVAAVLGLAPPLLTKQLIDGALPQHSIGLAGLDVAGMVISALAAGLVGVYQGYLNAQIGEGIMRDLRVSLVAHLQRMSLVFFTNTKTGEIMNRVSSDVDNIDNVLTGTLVTIVSNLAVMLSTVVTIFILDWRLALISLSIVPLMILPLSPVGRRMYDIRKKTREKRDEIESTTQETLSLSGITLIKSFVREKYEQQRFGAIADGLMGLEITLAMVGRWFIASIGAMVVIGPAIVWIAGAWFILHGNMTVGTVVAFVAFLGRLYSPASALAGVQVQIVSALAVFERILEYLDMAPESIDAPDAYAPARLEGDVVFDHVSFSYDRLALEQKANAKPTKPGQAVLAANTSAASSQSTRSNGTNQSSWSADGMRRADTNGGENLGDSANGTAIDGASNMDTVDRSLRTEISDVGSGINAVLPAVGGAIAAENTAATGTLEASTDAVLLPRATLADVSFHIKPGQTAAFVGASGAGKSTIASLVPRFYDVDDGAIRVDGVDTRTFSLAALRAGIGIVTQETYLFHDTIENNLRYGRMDATEDQMIAAAKAANIHDVIMAFPKGYATTVGERGHKLSGGERQRLAIARVLLKDPKILILDEATSALDSQNEALIQQALDLLIRGRTSLVVAHRLSTILAADVIHVVDRGRIVESGTHAELLAKAGEYSKLYYTQFGATTAGTI